MPETPLEFFLNGHPDGVYRRLADRGCLSRRGLSHRDEVLEEIARARAEHDPEVTGPSYVHTLAGVLIGGGMISKAGLELHKSGPRPLPELWDEYPAVTREIVKDT